MRTCGQCCWRAWRGVPGLFIDVACRSLANCASLFSPPALQCTPVLGVQSLRHRRRGGGGHRTAPACLQSGALQCSVASWWLHGKSALSSGVPCSKIGIRISSEVYLYLCCVALGGAMLPEVAQHDAIGGILLECYLRLTSRYRSRTAAGVCLHQYSSIAFVCEHQAWACIFVFP